MRTYVCPSEPIGSGLRSSKLTTPHGRGPLLGPVGTSGVARSVGYGAGAIPTRMGHHNFHTNLHIHSTMAINPMKTRPIVNDAADLTSAVLTGVRVQVPSPAPAHGVSQCPKKRPIEFASDIRAAAHGSGIRLILGRYPPVRRRNEYSKLTNIKTQAMRVVTPPQGTPHGIGEPLEPILAGLESRHTSSS